MSDTEEHNTQFESVESGASETYPLQCSALRKGGHVMIKDHPCKIMEMSTSKTGKHGHAKVKMVALDIFTGNKYEDMCPSTHNMDVPVVTRKEFSLIDIADDGFMALMDDAGNVRHDLRLPEGDLGKQIKGKFENEESLLITILKACKQEAAITFKNEPRA